MPQPVPENAIDLAPTDLTPHYEPMGWHHWPAHPWMTYQFRRGLGETQEGGGAVSECFLAASRMIPGDYDSWHREWMRIADQNWEHGLEAEKNGHIQTAKKCFLRAADYYRQAEFYLEPDVPYRLSTFEKMEACSHNFLKYLNPPGEVVDIPYEDGKPICGYFVRRPFPGDRMPVLICFGGLDYAVIAASDCVDTMDGEALHEARLFCIRTAFGWSMTNDEILTLGLLKSSEVT